MKRHRLARLPCSLPNAKLNVSRSCRMASWWVLSAGQTLSRLSHKETCSSGIGSRKSFLIISAPHHNNYKATPARPAHLPHPPPHPPYPPPSYPPPPPPPTPTT